MTSPQITVFSERKWRYLSSLLFSLSQAGKRSLGRALGWMDQYLEDAIDKVNKAISLIWQHFPFFKRLSEVDNRNEV